MIKLKDHPKIKEDIARYQSSILKIENETTKQELTELFLSFTKEITAIDMHHDSIALAGRLPEAVRESREKLASIRKKLENKLNSLSS